MLVDLGEFTPPFEYFHPACGEERITQGNIDIGAYEFSGAGAAPICR